MPTQELREKIKKTIIETLNIHDVAPDDIEDDEMIFENEKLDLDSLDALELAMGIQKEFAVPINNQYQAISVLRSVRTIAEYIESTQK